VLVPDPGTAVDAQRDNMA